MSKTMDELRKLSDAEQTKRLRDLRRELYELRFQKMTGKLEKYLRVRQVRRDIARLLTLKREGELED